MPTARCQCKHRRGVHENELTQELRTMRLVLARLFTQSRHRDSPRNAAVVSHVRYYCTVQYGCAVPDNQASVINRCFSSRSFAYRTQLAQKGDGLWIYLYYVLCPHVAEGQLAMRYRNQRSRLVIDEGCMATTTLWKAICGLRATSCQCRCLRTEFRVHLRLERVDGLL